jgi:hypothetical protein
VVENSFEMLQQWSFYHFPPANRNFTPEPATMLPKFTRFFSGSNKLEPAFFGGFALLQLLPILLPAWFYTYDGPAHLHNSYLLSQLLFDQNEFLGSWYQFNPNPEPNWTYYLLTVPLMQLFSIPWADKIALSIYALLFAYGYRRTVLQLKHPLAGWLAWPVFFFIYHFNFMLGQYNFAFSMAAFWWMLSYWLQLLEQETKGRWLGFGWWMYLTYFSHLVGFAAGGLAAGLLLLFPILPNHRFKWTTLLKLLAISLPLLSASAWFFIQKQAGAAHIWVERAELWQRLLSLQVLKVFNPSSESIALISLWLLLGAGFALYVFSYRTKRPAYHGLWLLSGCLLLLYFVLPDQTAGAGYISTRFALLCTMVLVLAASLQWQANMWWSMAIALLIGGQVYLGLYYGRNEVALGKDMAEFQEARPYFLRKAVVQQLNYSPGWLHEHFTEGIFAPEVVHLNNYEASNSYFPLRWQRDKYDSYDPLRVSLGQWPPCIDETLLNNLHQQVLPDQLLRWYYSGPRNACDSLMAQFLTENYQLSFRSSSGKLEIFTNKTLLEHAH